MHMHMCSHTFPQMYIYRSPSSLTKETDGALTTWMAVAISLLVLIDIVVATVVVCSVLFCKKSNGPPVFNNRSRTKAVIGS